MLSWEPVDLDNDPTVLLVRKHLVEHLGPPQEVFEVSGSPVPNSPVSLLNLAVFAPGGPDAPNIFATCGASRFRMKDGRRVEAMFVTQRRPDDAHAAGIRRLLASFAGFPEVNDEAVRLGDVVGAADELSAFCRMDAVLFVPPFTFLPSFHRIGLNDSEAIDLVWLLPVYEVEATYALEHGPQTLLLLFAAQSIDLTDPSRAAVDVTMSPGEAADRAQSIAEQPPPRRAAKRTAPAAGHVDDDTQQIKVQRRATKPAPPPSRPARRPVIRPKKNEPNEVRFDLAKDGVRNRAKPTRSSSKEPERPAPSPGAPARKLTKAERVAALKKAASEARTRAQARKEGKGPPPPSFPVAKPKGPPARPVPGRRPGPFRRGGPSSAAEADSDSARAAARRRGAPFRDDEQNE